MNNIVKMLSLDKERRMVIVDTTLIAKKQLSDFTGENCIREFLGQIITTFTLFSTINDLDTKVSLSLRLVNNISIYCMIAHSAFSLEFSQSLNEFKGVVSDLFDDKSIMSITTGDWETGLHTGQVSAHIDSANMLFSHFAVQSEQLPCSFILADNNTARGVMMQPLPFANEKAFEKNNDELLYLSKLLEQTDWREIETIYSHLGNVVSKGSLM